MDHTLDRKGLPCQMEDVIITNIPILTTKRRLQLTEIHELHESQRQKRQCWGLNPGLWAPRHKLTTTEPRCLPSQPSRLCYVLATSLCLPSRVPARLWELENELQLRQYRSWPAELGESLCKERDALSSGCVSTLPGHMRFQPTQPMGGMRSETAQPSPGGPTPVLLPEAVDPSGEERGLRIGEP